MSGWKRWARRCRRRLWESVGSDRFSRPALHELDRKLERYLDFDGGFFIEAGANDGFEQSNTYYFEALRGWRGLLIEPIPALACECRRNRRMPVVEAALTDCDGDGGFIKLHYAGLMTVAEGAFGDAQVEAGHVASGLRVQSIESTYTVEAPARTLSSLIDEYAPDREIDLVSLDIEGGEAKALRGLDFDRHAPRFICLEVRRQAEIEAILPPFYRQVAILSETSAYRDMLYARKP